eukprot:6372989-Prymnesium_polylepis.1
MYTCTCVTSRSRCPRGAGTARGARYASIILNTGGRFVTRAQAPSHAPKAAVQPVRCNASVDPPPASQSGPARASTQRGAGHDWATPTASARAARPPPLCPCNRAGG